MQDWIGYIGVKKIHGSFNNIVGLPTHILLYQKSQIIYLRIQNSYLCIKHNLNVKIKIIIIYVFIISIWMHSHG